MVPKVELREDLYVACEEGYQCRAENNCRYITATVAKMTVHLAVAHRFRRVQKEDEEQ